MFGAEPVSFCGSRRLSENHRDDRSRAAGRSLTDALPTTLDMPRGRGDFVELTGYLAVARRWWWTLLVATWVAAMAGLLVATRITPTYEAQAQLLVGPINTDSDTLRASGLLVQTYAQLAISPPLLQSTAQEAGIADPIKLGQNVRATANDTTRILSIRAQDADPAKAAKIANTMADELIQLTTGATTRPEGQLEVIGAAVPPTTPIAPQVSLIVLLAMAAGLIGGLILVIVVEYATDSVRDRSDLARLSGTEVLATISFDPRVPAASVLPVAEATAPGSVNAVAFRLLASKVAFSESDVPTQTILVAGVGEGDSAVVAMGIAAAVAGSGYRAVVIDGSSEGDITQSLGLTGRLGLREVVAREGIEPRSPLVDGPAGIQILPRGETGAAELIAVDRAREILESLLSAVDLIVIDGGAMQRSAGALSWARAAEESILLARRGASRREDLRLAVESLRFVNASIGGTVLVQRSPGRSFGRRRTARADASASLSPAIQARLPVAPSTYVATRHASPIEPVQPVQPVALVEDPDERPVRTRSTEPTIARTTGRSRNGAADPHASGSSPDRGNRSEPARSAAEERAARRTPRPRRAD
jgi:polysaccharide biosynthesis transport protein